MKPNYDMIDINNVKKEEADVHLEKNINKLTQKLHGQLLKLFKTFTKA